MVKIIKFTSSAKVKLPGIYKHNVNNTKLRTIINEVPLIDLINITPTVMMNSWASCDTGIVGTTPKLLHSLRLSLQNGTPL